MEPLVAEIERSFAELERQLGDPELIADQKRYADVARRHKQLSRARDMARRWRELTAQQAEADEMLSDGDEEIRALAQEQLNEARTELPELEEELRAEMLERDPADDKDVIVELRAGTGGDEAALFAGDLYQMLTRYAESLGFKTETLTVSGGDAGGFRELAFEIRGDAAYSIFKYESGVHRVQRVPQTESQGRIHTSTATVAVLPEAEDVDVEIGPNDLRIDVYRAGGHGGQSVNTTDSAVRITHLPTGLVVTCQDERSQLQNKERAMKILRARLFELYREQAQQEASAARLSQIGTGERSEKIRTYNYPQNRVTDHRINLTVHNLESVLAGNLAAVHRRPVGRGTTPEAGGSGGVITLAEVLRRSTGYLEQHGSPTPRLDAELLLAHGLGLSRIELYTQYRAPARRRRAGRLPGAGAAPRPARAGGLRDRQLGLPRSRSRGRRACAGAAPRDGAARRPLPRAAGGRRAPARRRRRHRLRRDRAVAQVRAPGRRGGRLRHLPGCARRGRRQRGAAGPGRRAAPVRPAGAGAG